jgi:hypothetical protein
MSTRDFKSALPTEYQRARFKRLLRMKLLPPFFDRSLDITVVVEDAQRPRIMRHFFPLLVREEDLAFIVR